MRNFTLAILFLLTLMVYGIMVRAIHLDQVRVMVTWQQVGK